MTGWRNAFPRRSGTNPKGSACYTLETRYPPDHAVNLVAFFQQQFREVGTILAGDTCYYGFLHGEAGGRLERRERVGDQRDGIEPAEGLGVARGARRARGNWLKAMGWLARRRLGEGGSIRRG
jgi:hypothetical protein